MKNQIQRLIEVYCATDRLAGQVHILKNGLIGQERMISSDACYALLMHYSMVASTLLEDIRKNRVSPRNPVLNWWLWKAALRKMDSDRL